MKKLLKIVIIHILLISNLLPLNIFIDVSSDEKMNESLEKIFESLSPDELEKFKGALFTVSFNGIDMFNTSKEEIDATMKRNLAWKTAEQIFREAENIKSKNKFLELNDKKEALIKQQNPIEKLREIRSWYVGEIWNDGIIKITAYLRRGIKDEYGWDDPIDIDLVLRFYNKEIKKLDEYNLYIMSLDEEKYDDIKYVWNKMYFEILNINNWIQSNEIKPNYDGEWFDTSKLSSYLDYFDKARDDLKK